MSQHWFSKADVMAVTGWSKRTVEWNAQRGVLRCRLSERPAANRKPEREYDPTSIPESAVNHDALHRVLLAQRLADEPEETLSPTTNAPSSTPLLLSTTDNRQALLPIATPPAAGTLVPAAQHAGELAKRRLAVPPALQARATRRMEAITPLWNWERGERPSILDDQGKPIDTKDQLAAWLGARYVDEHRQAKPVSRATIWNWLRRFKEFGEAGLVNNIRKDKDESKFFTRHTAAAKFVLAKYGEGQGRYSDVLIWEALKREWTSPQLYGEISAPPSLGTVRNYLKSVPQPLRDIARMPKQQHDQRHAPYVITDIAGKRPNEIWVTDHRIYDVIVVNDCFVGAPHLAALRLWETCIEDMRTRVIVGSVWNTTPSSRTIASALRQAIANYGMPKILYSDNGKDFRKIGGGWSRQEPAPTLDEQGRVLPMPSAQSLLERLGIEVKFCIPRHPQSKQVESYFSTVSKRFDVMFGRSYAGSKPSLRPDACRDAEKLHKQFLQGERRETPFVPASYFVQLHQQWTREFNQAHAHSGRGMDGRAPLEVFDELLPVREIPDMAALEPLFYDRVPRVVSNCKVELDRWEYEAVDQAGMAAMYLANGATILVARDPHDNSRALALKHDGSGLDHGTPVELRSKDLVARGPESADAIAATQRYQKRLFKAGKQFWQIAGAGVATEMQLLAQRGGIVAPPPPKVQLMSPRLAAVNGGNAAYAEDIAEQILHMDDQEN